MAIMQQAVNSPPDLIVGIRPYVLELFGNL